MSEPSQATYVHRGHWFIVMRRGRPVRQVMTEATAKRVCAQLNGEDEPEPAPPSTAPEPLSALDLPSKTIDRLIRAGLRTVADVQALSVDELIALPGVGPATAHQAKESVSGR